MHAAGSECLASWRASILQWQLCQVNFLRPDEPGPANGTNEPRPGDMIAQDSWRVGSIRLLAVMLPGPQAHDQESAISLECLMKRRDVDLRRSVWVPQANPVSTVVSPGLVDNGFFAMEPESDVVLVKPIPPNFGNTFH